MSYDELPRFTFQFFTTDPDIIRSMLTEITIFRKVDAIPNRTLFGQRITGTNSFLTVTDGSFANFNDVQIYKTFCFIVHSNQCLICNKLVADCLEVNLICF